MAQSMGEITPSTARTRDLAGECWVLGLLSGRGMSENPGPWSVDRCTSRRRIPHVEVPARAVYTGGHSLEKRLKTGMVQSRVTVLTDPRQRTTLHFLKIQKSRRSLACCDIGRYLGFRHNRAGFIMYH